MKKLINGIIDFRQKSIKEYRSRFANLALRQSPDTLFIACCDSRVVPNTFASSDPGDLLVLRNIGNLVPPYHPNNVIDPSLAAAIEFSLIDLKVANIIICGHSDCGAMHALIENNETPCSSLPHLNSWLKHAHPSYLRLKNSPCNREENNSTCNALSKVNVLEQLDNLKTYPLVREHLQKNQLGLHGWWFDLATANVYHYHHDHKKFTLIDEKETEGILAALKSGGQSPPKT